MQVYDKCFAILQLENRQMIFIVHATWAWYISFHSKWQHFASAFNCFACKYIQIGHGPKFYANNERRFELFFSLSLSSFHLFIVTFIMVLPNLSLKCSYNYLYIQFNYLPLESISGRRLILSLCAYVDCMRSVREMHTIANNIRMTLLFIIAESLRMHSIE